MKHEKFKTDPIMDARQKKALQEKRKQLPEHLKKVEKMLLRLGGSFAIVRHNEQDYQALVECGEVIDGTKAISERGEPNECHLNAARAFATDPAGVDIWTGYALSKDGIWRQHSWYSKNGVVHETTQPRVAYCGIIMKDASAASFVLGQLPVAEFEPFLKKLQVPDEVIKNIVARKKAAS